MVYLKDSLIILVNNCNGYQPVFSSKGSNFYVNEISIKDGDKISQKLNASEYKTLLAILLLFQGLLASSNFLQQEMMIPQV